MHLFNLDLHISVIRDVQTILQQIDPHIKITSWNMSEHNQCIFNEPISTPEYINNRTWFMICPQLIHDFLGKYRLFLEQFDGFIVTHTPVIALVFRSLGKPILMVNSCRYEQPFSFKYSYSINNWAWLSQELHEMWKSGQLVVVCNNRADQSYLYLGTGIDDTIYIPSLCQYTNATYHFPSPKTLQDRFLIHGPKLEMMTNMDPYAVYIRNIFPKRYSWHIIYGFRGIIHIPYECSTMSIFEQYTACVPLVFPSQAFLKKLIHEKIIPWGSRYNTLPHTDPSRECPRCLCPALGNNDSDDNEWIDWWLQRADFYNSDIFPHLVYFDSWENLHQLVVSLSKEELQTISNKMREHNKLRIEHVYNMWKNTVLPSFVKYKSNVS